MKRWELPEGWVWTTLAEIAVVSGGLMKGRRRSPDEDLRAVPYLRVANVQRGRLDLSEVKYIEATESEITALKLEPGDILFNEGGDRDQLGRGCVWFGELPECIHQNHVFKARLKSADIPPTLISTWGNSFGKDYFIKAGSQTTNLASISIRQLVGLPIPLPPLAEQHRIVKRLNALQARIHRARADLAELRELAAALKRSVLDAAFRGELTAAWRAEHPDAESAEALLDRLRAERRRRWEAAHPKKTYVPPKPVDPAGLPELPEGWCWAALGELIAEGPTNGYSGPVGGYGTPTLRLSATTRGELLLTDETTKRLEETIPAGSSYFLRDGDLLVQRANSLEYIGAAAIYRGPPDVIIYPDLMMRLRAAPGLDVNHLWRWLNGTTCHAYLRERATGTAGGMPKINGSTLVSSPVPLPPQSEQRQIAALVDSAWSSANRAIEAAQALANDLTATEHDLLTAAFRGDLVPRDPDDEPADALLARVQAQVAADEPSRRRR